MPHPDSAEKQVMGFFRNSLLILSSALLPLTVTTADSAEINRAPCATVEDTATAADGFTERLLRMTGSRANCEIPHASYPARDENWTFRAARELLTSNPLDPKLLQIKSRQDAGLAPPKKNCVTPSLPSQKVQGLVIHHAADPEGASLAEIQSKHFQRDWCDIGYHYAIALDPKTKRWEVYSLRPASSEGAQAEGRNGETLGIVIVGDYDVLSMSNPDGYDPEAQEKDRQPPPEAVIKLGQLVNKLRAEFPSVQQLYAHGSGPYGLLPGHTICPGPGCLHLISTLNDRFFPGATSPLTIPAAQKTKTYIADPPHEKP